jgi:hypothetical protein
LGLFHLGITECAAISSFVLHAREIIHFPRVGKGAHIRGRGHGTAQSLCPRRWHCVMRRVGNGAHGAAASRRHRGHGARSFLLLRVNVCLLRCRAESTQN